jgi:hypothetical protein
VTLFALCKASQSNWRVRFTHCLKGTATSIIALPHAWAGRILFCGGSLSGVLNHRPANVAVAPLRDALKGTS